MVELDGVVRRRWRDIYDPPARSFDFDTDFQQVQNLPPLTPQVVSVRQILFTENFR